MLRKGSYIPHILKYLLLFLSHYILKFLCIIKMVKKPLNLTAALKEGRLSVWQLISRLQSECNLR